MTETIRVSRMLGAVAGGSLLLASSVFAADNDAEFVVEVPPETAPVTTTDPVTVEPPAEDAPVAELPPAPPAEEVAIPVAIESAEPPTEKVIRRSKYKARIPLYQQLPPTWGIELSGSIKALGAAPEGLGGVVPKSASIQFEYQPAFLQSAGVFGIGPSLNTYIAPGAASGALGLFSVGGQARYQLRLFREQPIVPFAGFRAEYLKYSLASGPTGNFMSTGVFFGGMFLMNFLEPSAAAEFYVNTGVMRSYLVAELRSYSGADSTLTLSGSSLFFGLRFEF